MGFNSGFKGLNTVKLVAATILKIKSESNLMRQLLVLLNATSVSYSGFAYVNIHVFFKWLELLSV